MENKRSAMITRKMHKSLMMMKRNKLNLMMIQYLVENLMKYPMKKRKNLIES